MRTCVGIEKRKKNLGLRRHEGNRSDMKEHRRAGDARPSRGTAGLVNADSEGPPCRTQNSGSPLQGPADAPCPSASVSHLDQWGVHAFSTS